ncbi:hypothetical protein N7495_001239 [Penicillium taxi]|uniref:uncharacterized protein n=1 Tax=Penicillium taxi TaxID=168475 RepID=UPI00254523CF|nr:uncharacterized protein N7495_001239 [Penicillium taxi]KAJ5908557.1 hypothetical protein N7495_001239 [Penicillium taxi]
MASHQLTIAKASFSAGLLHPDPTSVTRDEISSFHTSLDRVLCHCTPANIQRCKDWLQVYVTYSPKRSNGLTKYLVALAGSDASHSQASPKRLQLHVLYLINDLLHTSKYHSKGGKEFSVINESLKPSIVDLFGRAGAYSLEKHPRHHQRLSDIVKIWTENGYFSPEILDQLPIVVKNAALLEASSNDVMVDNSDPTNKLSARNEPFVLPATHGDPTIAWYDLPAANILPLLTPNSTTSIRPEMIRPLQLAAGPANETLVNAVKGFMEEVDQIYTTGDVVIGGDNPELDLLGQKVARDEISKEILQGDTYYGWSREFSQRMKKRQKLGQAERRPYDQY